MFMPSALPRQIFLPCMPAHNAARSAAALPVGCGGAPFPACHARQRCQLAAPSRQTCSGKLDPSHGDQNSKLLRAFVSELTMWVVNWCSGWYGTSLRGLTNCGPIPKEYLEQGVWAMECRWVSCPVASFMIPFILFLLSSLIF
jgi:hypothetical protein